MVEFSNKVIEHIFEKYKNKIYGLALNMTHNDSDAEDILQNTFLKVINHLQDFRNESLLSTWIYKIAYNEALMNLRKKSHGLRSFNRLKRQEERIASNMFVNWPKLPDEQLLDEELKNRIDAAIRHLPIKYRMVILLHKNNDLSVREAAHILKLKENSLKTRLHRSYMMLKQEISDYLQDRSLEEEKSSRTCGILTSFVYQYATGESNKKRRHTFTRHIKDCPGCKSFLNAYSQAIRITKAVECKDIPLELQQKIRTFLLRHRGRK